MVLVLYGVAAIFAVLTCVRWIAGMIVGKRFSSKPSDTNENARSMHGAYAGASVTGHQFGIVNGTVFLGTPAANATAPVEPLAMTPPPIASIGPMEKRRVQHEILNRFREGPEGKVGIVVWITNERANAMQISSVGVSLTFRDNGAIVTKVNRSFGIGLTEYEKDLGVDTREAVLVCFCYGNILGLYKNSIRKPLPRYNKMSEMKHLLETFEQATPEYIPFDRTLEVEVAAISLDDGKTVGNRRYLLTPLVGDALINIRDIP